MRDMRGVGTVIGIDLGARNPRRIEFDQVPVVGRCCAIGYIRAASVAIACRR